MSYYFGKRSKKSLSTCHSDLQLIANNSIKRIDFTVIDGHRTREIQNGYFLRGVSKVKYPDSWHNTFPSLAMDCIPCPFENHYWSSQYGKDKFSQMSIIILEEAAKLDIVLLWGYKAWGWDLPHFQLISRNSIKYDKNIFKV